MTPGIGSLTFPKLTGTGLAACLAAGLVHQGYAAVATWRGHSGFERHSTRCGSGNIITYHLRRGAPDGPVLVCDAGLMSTSTAWLLVADHLDPAVTVVLYDRAGYRSSLRRCPDAYSLSESVNDLVDVVTVALGGRRTCVLAGHSLGGYLVHRAAAAAPELVEGVVLVDPTHPRELLHSPRQREGARAADMTIRLGPWTTLFGGGLLLDKREMFAFARGTAHHRALRLEVSASATWRAARREWGHSYAFMIDGGRPLDRLEIPVSVIAAEQTLRNSPEHRELLEEYVSSGTRGEVTTIADATHFSVVSGTGTAALTAKAIEGMLGDGRQEQREAA
ncbi:alpha/beta fold hydrolase [Streptomyces sp. NPDC059037]|uniref:alpha/beta hydrolase n=1 Tax=Streptomyces sp. NPDC059037 TaxID=3346710 RepID=UPI0036A29CFA